MPRLFLPREYYRARSGASWLLRISCVKLWEAKVFLLTILSFRLFFPRENTFQIPPFTTTGLTRFPPNTTWFYSYMFRLSYSFDYYIIIIFLESVSRRIITFPRCYTPKWLHPRVVKFSNDRILGSLRLRAIAFLNYCNLAFLHPRERLSKPSRQRIARSQVHFAVTAKDLTDCPVTPRCYSDKLQREKERKRGKEREKRLPRINAERTRTL